MPDETIYHSPWRERLRDGKLGPEYGPSPKGYAKRVASFRLWSWRPTRAPDQERVTRFVLAHSEDVPAMEVCVYVAIYERGMSQRAAAMELGISRSSVRVYVERLRARARK